ncbi:MAG: hypothetical protein Crog4KO_18800 [Crocinitomicaceae bacterium]
MIRLIFIVAFVPFMSLSQNGHQETTTYQYDDLNRLIQVDFSDGTTYNYVYDNLGNRIQLDVSQSSIGLDEELLRNTITVYPNPTTSNISIALPETINSDKLNILVLDMSGKIILEKEMTATNKELHLKTKRFESGTYLLKVSNQEENWSQLFIKK